MHRPVAIARLVEQTHDVWEELEEPTPKARRSEEVFCGSLKHPV